MVSALTIGAIAYKKREVIVEEEADQDAFVAEET